MTSSFEYRRKDGSVFPAETLGVPVTDPRGETLGYLGVIRDVTERKEAERKLRASRDELETRVTERTAELSVANERLKELDRLKSLFIASMSHELRTPLNAIIGFTGVMLQGKTGELPEETIKQLGFVQKGGRQLLALINDVIDVSKIEADLVVVEHDAFDLVSVARDIVEMCRLPAGRRA